MIEAGTDIFRLNCSHRRGGDFERVYPLIRKTAKEMGKKASGFLVPKGCHLFITLLIQHFTANTAVGLIPYTLYLGEL